MATGTFYDARRDYDGEVGSFRVNVAVLSAANFDAQAALRSSFTVALANIVGGNSDHFAIGNTYPGLEQGQPSDDPLDQRELKWLVQYHDTTTNKKYRCELPCADLSQLDPDDRKNANIGDAGAVDGFITAFEAYVLSEAGNAVEVDEITLVGRNL